MNGLYNMKLLSAVAALFGVTTILSACNDADTVSANISTDADNFKVNRRIVFYNGITGQYMLTIQGFCSLGNHDGPREVTVTCKDGPNSYKKDFLGLSDNVSYMAEQIENSDVSADHYKVIWKPETIIPSISIK